MRAQRLYASSNGYEDELAWAAAWLYKVRAHNEARQFSIIYSFLKQRLSRQLWRTPPRSAMWHATNGRSGPPSWWAPVLNSS